MTKTKSLFLMFTLISLLTLSACASNSSAPADAVAAYWQAMVAKDSAQLSSLSCAAFEAQSLITMESFGTFDPVLSGLVCEVTGTDGDSASVTCSGTIEVSYGAEILTIDLSQNSYAAVKEGGDWRMCGAE